MFSNYRKDFLKAFDRLSGDFIIPLPNRYHILNNKVKLYPSTHRFVPVVVSTKVISELTLWTIKGV